ncbi:TetR/AcrR family transcriptional regulator [Phenylobacterium sp.]|uniref:TetR/AcrR family transcriptional regulator n=1 Tax=Phenylobacterium sp. TaxID=1871053 RepID=UPI0025EFECFD|nr:TetR/AcrR family transcriptional regulator [Phenylobacterium sp.]
MDVLDLRKRPSQQRSARTMDVVLEAAAQVLEAGGLGAFNTNAVAARAGVSIGSIYQYFPGKDAVMAALIRLEAARFEAELARALEAAADLPLAQAVERLVALAVASQTARPNLARILDLEERRLGLEAEVTIRSQTTIGQLTQFLARHDVPDPQVAAGDLQNLVRGMVDGALHADPHDLTRRIARAAMGYLSGQAGDP